ncbi:hypothetical protein PHMEG_00024300 [Phytophthora megakarya]|uniref:Integrase zinc-binding domain-containing protein n=1 Tax=Phytophthora megakarya TaxID=4795 RepID=A0A225VED8_9STRA|nr:hypothetical protein PHMEG_00024300 [Phytophthora megakarya]
MVYKPLMGVHGSPREQRIYLAAFLSSHTGHRGQELMLFALKDRCFIVKLEDKIAKFVRQCLLCKHFKGPNLIPRPYDPLPTPTERNEGPTRKYRKQERDYVHSSTGISSR